MKTVIFDLDGTLLPINADLFLNNYFKLMAKQAEKYNYDPEAFINAVMAGTKAMLNNDGSMTNEKRFWAVFTEALGEKDGRLESIFDEFYLNIYPKLRSTAQPNEKIKKCAETLLNKGYELVVATNPLFPRTAIEQRIRWSGLKPEIFRWITCYENSSYSKPHLGFYKEILKNLQEEPENCLMIGNDPQEDMCVVKLGMQAFLLKDQMIAKEKELSGDCQFMVGYIEDLWQFVNELPEL